TLLASISTSAKPNSAIFLGDDSIDEDLDREIVLTTIDLFIQKTIESLRTIKDEKALLEGMAKARLDAGPSGSRVDKGKKTDENAGRGRGVDLRMRNGPLLSKEGRPLRPFVLTSQRQVLQEQVFRPGWNLPTMTLDQYLDLEAERGNILKGGGERPEKKEVDDGDEAALDAETYKAREFDDFKDDNPRGWGNRMNKG
ncbi:hypothetical protein HK102_001497, partial [Quaeritorhiza haematococci]